MMHPATGSDQKTILIVEDNKALRDAFCDILEAAKYRVVSASDGREALTLFYEQTRSVELLITDINMPEMDGIALAEKLRQKDAGLKVLLMSGQNPAESGHASPHIPIDGWLQKPVGLKDFLRAVNELLR